MRPRYVALSTPSIATPTSPLRAISPEVFPNNSRENENSPPRGRIKLRKNEMKLRKNEMKVPKNFSFPHWIIQNPHGGIVQVVPPSQPSSQRYTNSLCNCQRIFSRNLGFVAPRHHFQCLCVAMQSKIHANYLDKSCAVSLVFYTFGSRTNGFPLSRRISIASVLITGGGSRCPRTNHLASSINLIVRL